jgi:ketosteroid isomerase-like protein
MRRLPNTLMILALLAVTSACVPPSPDTSADAAALKANGHVWFDRYNSGDADGVTALYASDAVLLPAGAPMASGHTAIREYLAGDIERSRASGLSFKANDVTDGGVDGGTGWISGTFSVVDGSGIAVDTGKYLTLYQRAEGEWVIVRDIWNSDNPPAPPMPDIPPDEPALAQ